MRPYSHPLLLLSVLIIVIIFILGATQIIMIIAASAATPRRGITAVRNRAGDLARARLPLLPTDLLKKRHRVRNQLAN